MSRAPANVMDRARWATRIADKLAQGVALIFEIGDDLIAAKEQLAHGEYGGLLADLGMSPSSAQRFVRVARDPRLRNAAHAQLLPADATTLQDLTRLDDETLERRFADGTIHREMKRGDLKAADHRDMVQGLKDSPPALPQGKFRVIYADPPWHFETWDETGQDRAPPYATTPTPEICRIPVGDLAADDCALFLWAVSSQPADAYQVITAWGFRFATIAFVWVKPSISKGYWTRHRSEFCLLATRGNPVRLDAGVDQVIEAPVDRHSAKPHETYERIERLVGGPYVELFHRGAVRDGWHAWGNQSEGSAS